MDSEGVLELIVPVLPPSMNSMYGVRARGSQVQFFLKQEGRRFKENAKMFMPGAMFCEEKLYSLYVEVHTRWRYKNGAVKKQDVMNLDKLVCDAVAEKYLRGKDELFWERTVKKIESQEDKLFIRICCLK